MAAGYYCPEAGCVWTGLSCPPGQTCPRCGAKVEAYAKTPKPVAPAERERGTPPGFIAQEARAQAIAEKAKAGVVDIEKMEPDYDAAAKAHSAKLQREVLTATYETFALKLARLVAEKQIAYGDSFRHTRDVLKLFFPNGVPVEQYGDLLTITRIIDKLFRVANQKHYGGESPYEDIAGYATRAACEDQGGE